MSRCGSGGRRERLGVAGAGAACADTFAPVGRGRCARASWFAYARCTCARVRGPAAPHGVGRARCTVSLHVSPLRLRPFVSVEQLIKSSRLAESLARTAGVPEPRPSRPGDG